MVDQVSTELKLQDLNFYLNNINAILSVPKLKLSEKTGNQIITMYKILLNSPKSELKLHALNQLNKINSDASRKIIKDYDPGADVQAVQMLVKLISEKGVK